MAIRRVSDLPELTSIYPYESLNGKKCLVETSYSHQSNRYQSFYAGLNTVISVGLSACGIEVDDIVTRSGKQTITGEKSFTNENGVHFKTGSITNVCDHGQSIINSHMQDDESKEDPNHSADIPNAFAVWEFSWWCVNEWYQRNLSNIIKYFSETLNAHTNYINNINVEIQTLKTQINAINDEIAKINTKIDGLGPSDESNAAFPDYTSPLELKIPGNKTYSMNPPIDVYIASDDSNGCYHGNVWLDEDKASRYDAYKNTGMYIRAGQPTYYTNNVNATKKFYVYPILDGYTLNNGSYITVCTTATVNEFLGACIQNAGNILSYFDVFYVFGHYDNATGSLNKPKWTEANKLQYESDKWGLLYDGKVLYSELLSQLYDKITLVCRLQNIDGITSLLRFRRSVHTSGIISKALSPQYRNRKQAYAIDIATSSGTVVTNMGYITFTMGDLQFKQV